MYARRVLDDRTRIICVVGNTLAAGEQHQSRRHMRSALRSGATPKELLEVIFQTTGLFGHTHLMPAAIDDLIRITPTRRVVSTRSSPLTVSMRCEESWLPGWPAARAWPRST